jgi:hypothetical protein
MTADEIRAMLAAATPGPWTEGPNRTITAPDIDCPNDPWSVAKATGLCGWPIDQTDANASMIAAAPTIAALAITQAEEIERLREERNHWIDVARKQATMIAALKDPKP